MNTEQRPFCTESNEDLLILLVEQQGNLDSAIEELKQMRLMGISVDEWIAVRSLERIQDRSAKNIRFINDEIEIRKQVSVLVTRLNLLIIHGNSVVKKRRLIRLRYNN